jgi:hypothetical protein
LIFEGQGQARLHLKSKLPWSREWGPVQTSFKCDSPEGWRVDLALVQKLWYGAYLGHPLTH